MVNGFITSDFWCCFSMQQFAKKSATAASGLHLLMFCLLSAPSSRAVSALIYYMLSTSVAMCSQLFVIACCKLFVTVCAVSSVISAVSALIYYMLWTLVTVCCHFFVIACCQLCHYICCQCSDLPHAVNLSLCAVSSLSWHAVSSLSLCAVSSVIMCC